ncbi:MAG: GNAT family N-acetyltransferase [Nocardioidaceae bacterium]
MLIRTYQSSDAADFLALNQSNLDGLGPLDHERLAWLVGMSEQCLVADVDGTFAGFVLTIAPGTAYDSINYRWYAEHGHHAMLYLDRVAVDPAYRRRGIASALYDRAEAQARDFGGIALEVYIEPPNESSLAFHAARGYTEVGRLTQSDGKTCVMLVKSLTDSD